MTVRSEEHIWLARRCRDTSEVNLLIGVVVSRDSASMATTDYDFSPLVDLQHDGKPACAQ